MHKRLFFTIWAALGLILPGLAWGSTIHKSFHESFVVSEGVTLHLRHGDGDVVITAWEQDFIDVEVVYHAEIKKVGWGKEPTFDVEFEQRGDAVYVTERIGGGVTVGFLSSTREEYRYTIRAPRYAVLDMEGDDGDVDIQAMTGRIEIHLDDGNLQLRDCSSALSVLELSDGDVLLADHEGDVELSIDDGDVDFRAAVCRQLRVDANDGDLDLDLSGTTGVVDWRIQTDDGEVRLSIADAVSARLRMDCDDCRMDVQWPDLQVNRAREGRAEATLGTGEGRIRVETEDGDIQMIRAGPRG